MKLGDLRRVLESAADIHREAGNEAAVEALKELSSLCDGRETMTVSAFAKLVTSRRAAG